MNEPEAGWACCLIGPLKTVVERTISYAQNGEDIVLARAFGSRPHGLYVDVGANEPTHDSVTKLFYDRGWSGVNIEPQVSCIDRLEAERPRDTNLNIGIGSRAGELDFWFVRGAPAMSTFSPSHAELVRSLGYETELSIVPVRPLGEVLEQTVGDQVIDFLKVDVEGLEQEVLGELDWERWRPRVVVVESSPVVDAWEQRMVNAGYRRTMWDGINVFLVRSEDDAELGPLLQSPATLALDRFDPWLFVERVETTRRASIPYIEFYLASELMRWAPDEQSDAAAAVKALAETLASRPDLIAAFGAPPHTDLSALLAWGAAIAPGADEPHTAGLLPYRARYAALSTARFRGVRAEASVVGRSVIQLVRHVGAAARQRVFH